MKTVLILTCVLFSLSSVATERNLTIRLCNNGKKITHADSRHIYTSGKKLELIDLGDLPDSNYGNTKIVCGNFVDGEYLFLNPKKQRYQIHFSKECYDLIESMEQNPNTVYELVIDTVNKTVIEAVKTDDTDCTVNGQTILRL